jgi:hypothetical protein
MAPYIEPGVRKNLKGALDELDTLLKEEGYTEGTLNYVFFWILKRAWYANTRYREINKLIGVLECCKLEFYRRIAVNHENEAIYRNGDVK